MTNKKKDILIALCAAVVALGSVVSVSLLSRDNTLKATDEVAEVVIVEAADEIVPDFVAEEPVITSEVIRVDEIAEAPAEEITDLPDETLPEETAIFEPVEEPAAETEEPVEEPVAETEESAEEVPQPVEAAETEKSVEIWFEFNGEISYGSTVTIRSASCGYSEFVAYQWQYSIDGTTWLDVEGAQESEYSFILNEANALYLWRLEVTEIG